MSTHRTWACGRRRQLPTAGHTFAPALPTCMCTLLVLPLRLVTLLIVRLSAQCEFEGETVRL